MVSESLASFSEDEQRALNFHALKNYWEDVTRTGIPGYGATDEKIKELLLDPVKHIENILQRKAKLCEHRGVILNAIVDEYRLKGPFSAQAEQKRNTSQTRGR